MPEWISVWIAKIFGNEPVVKMMLVIVIWLVVLFVAPDAWGGMVATKIGFTYAWHIFSFAAVFLMVDVVHRLVKRLRFSKLLPKSYLRKRMLDSLTVEEIELLSTLVEMESDSVSLPPGSRNAVIALKLMEKGVFLYPSREFNGPYTNVRYRLAKDYSASLLRKHFDIKTNI